MPVQVVMLISVKDTVSNNGVTILMAETGSGKSTQVAQYIHDMNPEAVIVCTQPRKIAAVSLAAHVAQQMGAHVGGLVGYKVGSANEQTGLLLLILNTPHTMFTAPTSKNSWGYLEVSLLVPIISR